MASAFTKTEQKGSIRYVCAVKVPTAKKKVGLSAEVILLPHETIGDGVLIQGPTANWLSMGQAVASGRPLLEVLD